MRTVLPSEAELAKDVLDHLRAEGWETFQEVNAPAGAADIVATRGQLVAVVECKKRLCIEVIEQAYRWLPYAHFVWAAVWGHSASGLLWRIANDFGIGVVTNSHHNRGQDIREHGGRLNRRPPAVAALRALLAPQHKGGYQEAGTNHGRRWTPYQSTLHELRNAVKAQPGITLKDAIDSIRHHYASSSSARASLKHWLDAGKVEGLRVEQDGRLLKLYPMQGAR